MEVKDVLGKNDCENGAHRACHMPLLRADPRLGFRHAELCAVALGGGRRHPGGHASR